jgi:hypothetical protein
VDERPRLQRKTARQRAYLQQPLGHGGHGAQHFPFGALGAPNAVSASIPAASSTSIFFISSTSFLVRVFTATIAATVLSNFQASCDALLLKPNVAASVLSKFEALSEAISVSANALVTPCIGEMAQKSFD